MTAALTTFANNDTTKVTQLKEVSVEAQNQRASATATSYIPSRNQREAAQNAVALLSQMAIPQLDISPLDRSVKTVSGEEVSLFIDYVPATEQDIQGMRTADVRRVEYLIYPTDPRFRGAKHVVNFIMQKYEWGGYTKLSAAQDIAPLKTDASVYSKFVYRRMTYDLFAGDTYSRNTHGGQQSVETMRFTDLWGNGPATIQRYQTTDKALNTSNAVNLTFRASYNTEKVQFTNNLYTNILRTPHNDFTNSLRYGQDVVSEARTEASSDNTTFSYNPNLFVAINKKFSINFMGYYMHARNGSNTRYTTGNLDITNDAVDIMNRAHGLVSANWNVNKHNTLMAYAALIYIGNKVTYKGTTPYVTNYDIWATQDGLKWQYHSNRVNINSAVGLLSTSSKINGKTDVQTYPTYTVSAQWSPSQRHQLSGWMFAGCDLPSSSQKSPNMVRQDEYIWYAGNQDLDRYTQMHANLSYTWLPSNKYQMTLSGQFARLNNRIVSIYTPTGPDGTLLRQYVNGGSHTYGKINLNITGKWLGNKLIGKVAPGVTMMRNTEYYAMSRTDMTCSAQLTYYMGNFYVWGWYTTPTYGYGTQNGSVSKWRSSYQLAAGWGKGNWQTSLAVSNFLRSSWEQGTETVKDTWYSMERTNYGSGHWNINASVTYTFGYGKKVQRGNEATAGQAAGSAILQ